MMYKLILLSCAILLAQSGRSEEIFLDKLSLAGMSSGWSTPRVNKAISGQPLKLGKTVYTRGVGTHADSSLSIKLHGSAIQFKALVGVDGGRMNTSGSVEFLISGDDKVLFKSGVMKGTDAPKEIRVDLTGVKVLKLDALSGGDGINGDHANWINASITYTGKVPEGPSLFWPASSSIPARSKSVVSPNGVVRFYVFADETGMLCYGVKRGKTTVIHSSPLGMMLNDVELGSQVKISRSKTYTVNEVSPTRGVHSQAKDHCNGSLFTIKNKGGKTFVLDVRAYDDGVGFRYLAKGAGPMVISKELTGFSLPLRTALWATCGNEERIVTPGTVKAVGRAFGGTPYLPITARVADTCFLSIMEAGRGAFPGLRFCRELGSGRFRAVLSGTATQSDAIATPWRVIKIAADLNDLVNNDMVHNLSAKPDPNLFPQGYRTAWIKPGKVGWSWMCGGGAKGVNLQNQKLYVDYAQTMNYPYVLVDEGWRHWNADGGYACNVGGCRKDHGETPWNTLKELVEYAAERGVRIWAWKSYDDRRGVPGIKDPVNRKTFFSKCSELGIVGVKLDFFPAPSQDVLTWQWETLREAAEYKLMVNFHGCAIPAGESRTWPNEMTREAVRGLECGGIRYIDQAVRLPFTRLLSGHADYTPLWTGRGGASLAHHIASVAVLDSSVVHFCEHPKTIHSWGDETWKLIMGIPECWDETRVLPPSEIGKVVVYARRKGKEWYLAVLCAKDVTLDIPLDFLTPNLTYQSTGAHPGEDFKGSVEIKQSTVTSQDALKQAFKRGGGCLLRLIPK